MLGTEANLRFHDGRLHGDLEVPVNRRALVGSVGAAVAVAVAAASFSSVSVRATEPTPVTPQSAQVNLGSAEGAENFYARIELAARAACATPGQEGAARVQGQQACVQAAIERAVREVNSPWLTKVYIQHDVSRVADSVIVLGERARLARN
jgi:UrcA family protein